MRPTPAALVGLVLLVLAGGLMPGTATADRPLPSWARYQARSALALASRALTHGDSTTASNASQRACALTPSDPTAWLLLARSSAAGADWLTARTAVERAVELAPGALGPTLLEGHILVQLAEREAALASFARAARLDPSGAGSHFGLALVAARLDGDWASCARHLRAASKADPDAPLATLPLQDGWRQLGDNPQFIEALEWVLRDTAL